MTRYLLITALALITLLGTAIAYNQEEQTYLNMQFELPDDLAVPEDTKILEVIDTTRYILPKYDGAILAEIEKQVVLWKQDALSGNAKQKEQAIVALVNSGNHEFTGNLIKIMLNDQDRYFRHLASWGLTVFGPEVVLEQLLELAAVLTEQEEQINVIWVIGELRKPGYKVEQVLEAYLKDPTPAVRLAARMAAHRLKIELITEQRQKTLFYKVKPLLIKIQ